MKQFEACIIYSFHSYSFILFWVYLSEVKIDIYLFFFVTNCCFVDAFILLTMLLFIMVFWYKKRVVGKLVYKIFIVNYLKIHFVKFICQLTDNSDLTGISWGMGGGGAYGLSYSRGIKPRDGVGLKI